MADIGRLGKLNLRMLCSGEITRQNENKRWITLFLIHISLSLYHTILTFHITIMALESPIWYNIKSRNLNHNPLVKSKGSAMISPSDLVFNPTWPISKHTGDIIEINIVTNFNRFPNKPWFLRVCSTCLFKTLWEKKKLLVTSNFSFSQCFLPFGELSAIFIKFKIDICKVFQFGVV